jgi:hypothetical protein
MAINRLMRVGLLLVMLGLVVQIGCSFLWSPGTFIISAALGAPLVVAGTVAVFLGARRTRPTDREGGPDAPG